MNKENGHPNYNNFDNSQNAKVKKIIAALAIGIVCFVNTDKSSGHLLWNSNNTEINVLTDKTNKIQEDNLWIVLPGLGVDSGYGMASVLNSSLSPTGDVAYANYSDEGIDIELLAKEITEIQSQYSYNSVSFYAHSMGGTIMLNILKELDNSVPVDNIILDCSPYSIYDAKNKVAPLAATIVPPTYEGGAISKIIYESVNNAGPHKNDRLSTLQQLKDAARIALTGSSPFLFVDQLGLLGSTSPDNMKELIPDSTNVYYIKPDNSNNDDTVNDDTAYNNWKNYLNNRITSVTVYGGGHANPTERPGEYAKALHPFFVAPSIDPLERNGQTISQNH
ncbi:hypothetical protein KA025_01185 [Candidatus Saccharibacteria bacterium]|jgi:pimeloyl-ACP methyl ester carboxylesterase|nr:hypothetical protein [Candidatus Saccharibacteria bacterium]MBP7834681.1 hypothetical protein [Candidatus Saccharibacteria bacterium]